MKEIKYKIELIVIAIYVALAVMASTEVYQAMSTVVAWTVIGIREIKIHIDKGVEDES